MNTRAPFVHQLINVVFVARAPSSHQSCLHRWTRWDQLSAGAERVLFVRPVRGRPKPARVDPVLAALTLHAPLTF